MNVEDLKLIYSDGVVFIDPIAKHTGLTSVELYFNKLLENTQTCSFNIIDVINSENNTYGHDNNQLTNKYTVTWTMSFSSTKFNAGKMIEVDGVTVLKVHDEKIIYHRDYYDLGQMIYEKVPVLGFIVQKIKKGMR